MIKVLILSSISLLSVAAQQTDINRFQNYFNPASRIETDSRGSNFENQLFLRTLQGNYLGRKECSRRRTQSENLNPIDHWSPSYHPKSSQPITNSIRNLEIISDSNPIHSQSLTEGESFAGNSNYFNVNTKELLNCPNIVNQNKFRTQNSVEKEESAELKEPPPRGGDYIDIQNDQPATELTTEKIPNDNDRNPNCISCVSPVKGIGSTRRFITDDIPFAASVRPYINGVPNRDVNNYNDKFVKENNNEGNRLLARNLNNPVLGKNLNNGQLQRGMQNFESPKTMNFAKQNAFKVTSKDKNDLKDTNVSDKSKRIEEKKLLGGQRMARGEIEDQLIEPAKGNGIVNISDSRVMLMENSRVCYACSSTSDPSCWSPTRRTTVKYCRRGHNACVTKTYQSKGSELIVIRDCSNSCDISLPILDTRYQSCSICKSDLCNSNFISSNNAFSIKSYNFIFCLFLTMYVMCGL